MKKYIIMLLFTGLSCGITQRADAQVQEAIQLALNIQKLNQLRKILQNMYDGYKILTDGYNKVKGIIEGNYKIHELFLDGLMAVNPKIRSYKRVADIINAQKNILKEYKNAYKRFRQSNAFNEKELDYISKVYKTLTVKSLHNVDELLMVMTAGKLRMSDGERLEAIDRLYIDISDQLSFLRSFNSKASVLALQRSRVQTEVNVLRGLHGVTK